jgi:hypothetical protein
MMHFKYDATVDIPNGMHAAVKGKLLQATFQPVWVDGLSTGSYTFADSFAREKPSSKKPSSKKQRTSPPEELPKQNTKPVSPPSKPLLLLI